MAGLAWTPALTIAVLVGYPGTAHAHPLGNFSVNQYAGLILSPDRISAHVVVNTAEIPTVQDRATADANHDNTVTDQERADYAAKTCGTVAAGFAVQVGTRVLSWQITPGTYQYLPGATGLPTARLSCQLTAPAALAGPTTVTVLNQYLGDRVGWHEMTVTGDGVHVIDSPLLARSVSDELTSYPPVPDPASVLNVRTATLRVAPGAASAAPTGGGRRTGTDALTAATTWAERRFEQRVAGRLTPTLAVLGVVLALLLGAGHAALPGHGKTVLAAYLAGQRGRPRDALVVGATVTATHTGAVLAVGLLLTTATWLAGDRVLGYLGLVSGTVIVAVGANMLVAATRRRGSRRAPGQGHSHGHDDDHGHDHGHGHDHDHGHDHGHGYERPGTGRWGLAGLGLAGGLVPSPSALVVLLAAVGLGRTLFGVLLVVAYGLGMAATLTAAGLLLLALQRRLAGRRVSRLVRLSPAVPFVTATLVLVVGLGLAVRAAAGLA